MFIVACEVRGVMLCHAVPQDQTVSTQYCHASPHFSTKMKVAAFLDASTDCIA
jgi:hypothetical protein